MIEKIHERVSVLVSYNRNQGQTIIHKVRWNGKIYLITQFGYHHKVRSGRNIFHIFHVNTDSISFKLELNTETLVWSVLEVSDGDPN